MMVYVNSMINGLVLFLLGKISFYNNKLLLFQFYLLFGLVSKVQNIINSNILDNSQSYNCKFLRILPAMSL